MILWCDLHLQPEQRARKRQRYEEPGGRDKPIVGHLAAVAHDIVGWPTASLQQRSPAMPQVAHLLHDAAAEQNHEQQHA